MKIKMYQVFKVLEIYKRVKEAKAPARVAYKFNKLCIELEKDANFYTEELKKIVEQYADRDGSGTIMKTAEGDVIQLKPEYVKTAQNEIDALWTLDIDAPDIEFSIDELDGLELSIEDFNSMLPFIKED